MVVCLMIMATGYAQHLTPSQQAPSSCSSQDTIARSIRSFSYGFNSDFDGWTLIDNDGDGHNWYHSTEASNHSTAAITSYEGSGHLMGESYCNSAGYLLPDDYLVSPQRYGIINGSTITFWCCAQDVNYVYEHFGVAISSSPSGNNDATTFTTIQEWTLSAKGLGGVTLGRDRNQTESGTWHQYTCNLSDYAGQQVWIAIRHFGCADQFIICLDDVSLNNVDTWCFEQGFVTDIGAMANGADASWTKGSQSTWGPNVNHDGGYMLADEFTISSQTNINEIVVYGYQTGSTTTSTFTGIYAQIFNGNPMNGGTAIWGDNTNNIITATSFTNCYRGSNGETEATTRPIMSITTSGLNIQLAAGTYYLVYSLTGSESSGPWGTPQCEPSIGNTGNGLQYSSDSWQALIDTGSGTSYGCSMTLNGTQESNNSYTITVAANPTNGGSVYIGSNYGTTQATFTNGETCTIHAAANSGYVFQQWMKNGTWVSNNPNYNFQVTENATYTAYFTEQGTSYYTIQTNVTPAGAGTVTGGGSLPAGSTTTLTATANNGYTFSHWQDGNIQNPRTITVTGNATYTAYFTQNVYTITTEVTPAGSGTVTGGGSYHYGDTPTLTAYPNEGYTFAHWNDGNTQNPRTITVTGNATYTATFNEVTTTYYTVSANVSPSGAGTVTGTGTFPEGTTITLHAIANNGYSFDHWNDGSTQNPRTVTVTGNITYTAYFNQLQYNITVNVSPANSGTVTGGGTYYYNQTCNLHASPNEGYVFQNWKKNGVVVSEDPDYSFHVTGNATYTAYFGEAGTTYYTVTADVVPEGAGTVTGTGTFPAETTTLLKAEPNPGYVFDRWNDGVTLNPRTVTVNENMNFTAYFMQNQYVIRVLANPEEGGTVSGGGTYHYGDTCTVHATPNAGFVFINWTEDGEQQSSSDDYTFIVTDNRTLVANFGGVNGCIIYVGIEPEGAGTVTGAGAYIQGDECTLNAYANPGYRFKNWTKNEEVVSTEHNYTFTVTESASYVAHFEIKPCTITASANPPEGGTVSGDGTYVYGLNCTLRATPNPGYIFTNWKTGDIIVSMEASYTFVVREDAEFTATFTPIQQYYTISAMAGANGSITPQGDVQVAPGNDQSFTMTPNTGCSISKVLVDGIDIGAVGSYTFTNVNRNHTISVSFSGMGVEEMQSSDVNIYPNPAMHKVYLEGDGIETVTLYDMLGNCLSHTNYNTSKELNVSGLPKGTYILKLTSRDGHIGYQKLVLN